MKNSFTIYADYAEQLELLSNNQCGVLFRALMDYANGREVPAMDTLTNMAFLFIKGNIEREEAAEREDTELNSLRSQWGKLGGRPKKVKKGTFSENKVPFDTFSDEKGTFLEKEASPQEKERSKEKESTPEEKESPPIVPPEGETDGTIEGYLAFMREHPYITEDFYNPDELCGVDFALLAQKISESRRFLAQKNSLKWLIKHYAEIIGDSYKDFPVSPPQEPPKGKGDLQLWQELVRAIKSAKEERYCESTGAYAPLYRRLDEAADDAMKALYRSLSKEIMAYFDPNSFLELCDMSDNDLKFERARFLKALPQIRAGTAGGHHGA